MKEMIYALLAIHGATFVLSQDNPCPNGRLLALIPGTTLGQACSPFMMPDICTAEYQCTSTLKGFYCCSKEIKLDVCPPDLEPYLVPNTPGLPQPCDPSDLVAHGCPDTYGCVLANNGVSFCCRMADGGGGVKPMQVCPNGWETQWSSQVSTSNRVPVGCLPEQPSACETSFECSPGLHGQYFCCKNPHQSSTQITAAPVISHPFCPPDTLAETYPGTQIPKGCSPGGKDCSKDTVCQRGSIGQHYCCTLASKPPLIQHCSTTGSMPDVDPTTGDSQKCSVYYDMCQPGAMCEKGSDLKYYCCRPAPLTCQPGEALKDLTTAGIQLRCFPNKNTACGLIQNVQHTCYTAGIVGLYLCCRQLL